MLMSGLLSSRRRGYCKVFDCQKVIDFQRYFQRSWIDRNNGQYPKEWSIRDANNNRSNNRHEQSNLALTQYVKINQNLPNFVNRLQKWHKSKVVELEQINRATLRFVSDRRESAKNEYITRCIAQHEQEIRCIGLTDERRMVADILLVRNIADKITKTDLNVLDSEHGELIDLTDDVQSVLSEMDASIEDIIFIQGHTFTNSPECRTNIESSISPVESHDQDFRIADDESHIGQPVNLTEAYVDSEVGDELHSDISLEDTSGDAALARALQNIYDATEVPQVTSTFAAEDSEKITV
jgi:hypothetical protein